MKLFTQTQFVVGTMKEVQVAVGKKWEWEREREQVLSAEEMRGGEGISNSFLEKAAFELSI